MPFFGDKLPQKIAIVRMLPGLGDFLVIIPALRAIRSVLPKALITLIGFEPARSLCRRFKYYFDFFEQSPGFPGIPEREPDLATIPSFLEKMQACKFDLAIQMHGDGTISNIFTSLLKPRLAAGHYRDRCYCPDSPYYLKYNDRESEITRYLRLVESLGFPAMGEELEFPLTKRDRTELFGIEDCRALSPQDYVCIHPGASSEIKQWPFQYFVTVGEELSRQGWRVVLTGSRSERDLCNRVEHAMERKPVNLAGRTTLGSLAMLISDAALVICNDTGISHLASALNVASVVIFLASDPVRWAPLDNELHRVVCGYDYDNDVFEPIEGTDTVESPRRMPGVESVLAEAEVLLRPKRRNFA